jgi:hypothetical protein
MNGTGSNIPILTYRVVIALIESEMAPSYTLAMV